MESATKEVIAVCILNRVPVAQWTERLPSNFEPLKSGLLATKWAEKSTFELNTFGLNTIELKTL